MIKPINEGSSVNVFIGTKKDIKKKLKYLEDYKYKSTMKEIYNKADIISLHIPLTKETTYLVNENFINNFEKNFYLINTARGKCVNTKSLVNSMKEGKIKGVSRREYISVIQITVFTKTAVVRQMQR